MPYPLAFTVPCQQGQEAAAEGMSAVNREVSLVLETVHEIGRGLRQIDASSLEVHDLDGTLGDTVHAHAFSW